MIMIEEGETRFGTFVSDLPRCVAVGETETKVKQLIQEAVEFHPKDLQDSCTVIP